MKKIFSLIMCVVMLVICSSLIAPAINEGTKVSAATEATIANPNEARFLNMLNHNFVYNGDFDSADAIVNNAALALLDLRDSENQDYISDLYVKDFVKDMYGIEIADMSAINADCPQLDGYLYIVPRGYTTYKHTIVSVEENEDGSYTVVSEIAEQNHDAKAKTQKAVSLFVKNNESAFGYNMIYCNIVANSTDI